jgi:outer membrane protein assembly factor BamB
MTAGMAIALLKKAGVTATLCEMPRVGDGVLAAELAAQGVAVVHGLAVDVKAVEDARRPAAAVHMLGSHVIIERGSPTALPLGDLEADLVVVADATDNNLAELSVAEITRVLAPYRGVALIGNPAGATGGLTKATLRDWAKGMGGAAAVTEDSDGLWAVVTMAPLKGGDDWGHFMHGADENLVSRDTAFTRGPLALQWTGAPFIGGNWDINVISAGRLFTAQGSSPDGPDNRPHDEPYELVARNLYNGTVMWTRPIPPDFGESLSLVVATPQELFLKDAGAVLELQPETGTPVRRFVASQDNSQTCLWLLESDGVLLALTCPVDKYDTESKLVWGGNKLKDTEELNELFYGSELVAWDVKSGKELWRFSEQQIDPCSIAILSGRVYLYAKLTYAACFDLRSGAQLWKTSDPISDPAVPGIGFIDINAPSKDIKIYRSGGIATKDVYLISYEWHRQCQAFATADGHVLWEKMKGPTDQDPLKTKVQALLSVFNSPIVIDSRIIEKQSYKKPSNVYDLLSGNPVLPGSRFGYGGCGRGTGTTSGLLFGQCGEVFDLTQDKIVFDYDVKGPCGGGVFVADGCLVKPQDNGDCDVEWRCPIISRPRSPIAAQAGARLDSGRVASATSLPTSDACDWPTYRDDVTRKSSSSAQIPAHAKLLWTFDPAQVPNAHIDQAGGPISVSHPGPGNPQYGDWPRRSQSGGYLPDANSSPVVAVGDRVWLGSADGAIVCLDRTTGGEQWRFWTAGRIMASPTWWQGRLYAGSCDGWVYCLDAASGAMVWRYRVAPAERRVMMWERLSSAWPVMANVLVQDGVVYAGAGAIGPLDGVVLCALDALTGQPRWERRFDQDAEAPTAAGQRPGWLQGRAEAPTAAGILAFSPTAAGQMAWSQGRLWWHVGWSGLRVIDPATGAVEQAFDSKTIPPPPYKPGPSDTTWSPALSGYSGGGEFANVMGQDIGILPGGWVACGGRLFNTPLTAVRLRGMRGPCMFVNPNPVSTAQGGIGVPRLFNLPNLQGCDQGYDYLPNWDDQGVLLCGSSYPGPTISPTLVPSLGSIVTAPPHNNLNRLKPVSVLLNRGTSWYTPILAKNAMAFIVSVPSNTPSYHIVWHLMAVSRDDSSLMWDFECPAMPALGELAMGRAGEIVAPLVDGRVVCIGVAK